MLGWEFIVQRQEPSASLGLRPLVLARWRAGLGGTEWIDELVSKGVATALGGNGYPNRYTVPAGALVSMFSKGIPKHEGPLVIGDDYVLPGGWTGDAEVDITQLNSLDPNEVLVVDAWDQS